MVGKLRISKVKVKVRNLTLGSFVATVKFNILKSLKVESCIELFSLICESYMLHQIHYLSVFAYFKVENRRININSVSPKAVLLSSRLLFVGVP